MREHYFEPDPSEVKEPKRKQMGRAPRTDTARRDKERADRVARNNRRRLMLDKRVVDAMEGRVFAVEGKGTAMECYVCGHDWRSDGAVPQHCPNVGTEQHREATLHYMAVLSTTVRA